LGHSRKEQTAKSLRDNKQKSRRRGGGKVRGNRKGFPLLFFGTQREGGKYQEKPTTGEEAREHLGEIKASGAKNRTTTREPAVWGTLPFQQKNGSGGGMDLATRQRRSVFLRQKRSSRGKKGKKEKLETRNASSTIEEKKPTPERFVQAPERGTRNVKIQGPSAEREKESLLIGLGFTGNRTEYRFSCYRRWRELRRCKTEGLRYTFCLERSKTAKGMRKMIRWGCMSNPPLRKIR